MPATHRTTIEIPAPLLRLAKANAVARHTTLKGVMADALTRYLVRPSKVGTKRPVRAKAGRAVTKKEPAWMKAAGTLPKDIGEEMLRNIAEADFSKVNPEDWQ